MPTTTPSIVKMRPRNRATRIAWFLTGLVTLAGACASAKTQALPKRECLNDTECSGDEICGPDGSCIDSPFSTSSATTGSQSNATTVSAGSGGVGGNSGSSTSVTTATTASTSTSTGGGSGGNCAKACGQLYACGLEKDGAAQLCPGFKGGDEVIAFVKGSMDNGCEASCKAQPALAALIDPANCKGTITTLKNLNSTFKDSCDEGLNSGACVTCAEFYSNNGVGELCPGSLTLAVAFNDCACNNCTAECGQNCDSIDVACNTCLQNAALDQCFAENMACANDT